MGLSWKQITDTDWLYAYDEEDVIPSEGQPIYTIERTPTGAFSRTVIGTDGSVRSDIFGTLEEAQIIS